MLCISLAMSWFSALLCCLGRRKEPDDLTSFSGEMPAFDAELESVSISSRVATTCLIGLREQRTFVNYLDGENAIFENHAIKERIKDQEDIGSDQNTNEKTKGTPAYSESMSDQSTLVRKIYRESQDLEPSCGSDQGAVTVTERDTDIEAFMAKNNGIAASAPFVKDSTGECMVHLIEVTTICLDRCRIRGVRSHIPNSDEDEIEVLFYYKGEYFWVYVQYAYVKDRDDFNLTVWGDVVPCVPK